MSLSPFNLKPWGIIFGLAAQLIGGGAVQAQSSGTSADPADSPVIQPVPLRQPTPCPTDINHLMQGLLRDLPSYTNRAYQRSSGPYREIQRPGVMVVASQPDLSPLPLNDWGIELPMPETSNLHQVFFTTLERQHTETEIRRLQVYHWVFLTRSSDRENDWRLAFMYSSLGPYPSANINATPPEESSNSAVGQSVRLWLRDCRAQAVDPV